MLHCSVCLQNFSYFPCSVYGGHSKISTCKIELGASSEGYIGIYFSDSRNDRVRKMKFPQYYCELCWDGIFRLFFSLLLRVAVFVSWFWLCHTHSITGKLNFTSKRRISVLLSKIQMYTSSFTPHQEFITCQNLSVGVFLALFLLGVFVCLFLLLCKMLVQMVKQKYWQEKNRKTDTFVRNPSEAKPFSYVPFILNIQ